MTELVFWSSVFLIVYPYAVYPVLIHVLGWIRPRSVRRYSVFPTVTVLIPAYNEANCIAKTIWNKLDQDYPREKLEIIVVSDGSIDGTDDIVRGFVHLGVLLLRREGREGKAAALNEAVRHATGEILVFSDANSLFDRDAIRFMVENFADPEVGYVTGRLRYVGDGAGLGGGTYMRHENRLRSAETRIGSIIGVNGGVDAIRRELYRDIPRELITDFVLPLHVIASGRRVIYDPRVVSQETANSEITSEFRMRVRVALRAMQGLVYMRRLLDPRRYPLASFCLLSHKVLRYLTFVFLPVVFLANIWLAYVEPLYRALLVAHIFVYVLALIGLYGNLSQWLRRLTVVPSYFLLSNTAFMVAAVKFMRRETMATWKPRAG